MGLLIAFRDGLPQRRNAHIDGIMGLSLVDGLLRSRFDVVWRVKIGFTQGQIH